MSTTKSSPTLRFVSRSATLVGRSSVLSDRVRVTASETMKSGRRERDPSPCLTRHQIWANYLKGMIASINSSKARCPGSGVLCAAATLYPKWNFQTAVRVRALDDRNYCLALVHSATSRRSFHLERLLGYIYARTGWKMPIKETSFIPPNMLRYIFIPERQKYSTAYRYLKSTRIRRILLMCSRPLRLLSSFFFFPSY